MHSGGGGGGGGGGGRKESEDRIDLLAVLVNMTT